MSYYGHQQQQGNPYGDGYGQQQSYNQQQQQQQWNPQPTAQPQQYNQTSQQQQQQQQSYGQQSSVMGDASMMQAAAFIGAAATSGNGQQVALEAGKKFLESEMARMIPGLEALMISLRRYFAVDNNYVKLKMQRVLFPFSTSQWQRQGRAGETIDAQITYDLPTMDVNAPDMYIPSMSLITYALLCAVIYGTAGKFNPEVLPDVVTKCLLLQALEMGVLKVGCVYNETPMNLLDTLCYSGYKYLGLVVNMLIGLLFLTLGLAGAKKAYYVTFLYTSSAVAWFLLKTISSVIPVHRQHRKVVIFAMAGLACATMWLVSDTKFLVDSTVTEKVATAATNIANKIKEEVEESVGEEV